MNIQKYWQIYKVYLSRVLVYRLRALIWTLNDAVSIFVLPLVWLAAFGDKETLGGFTRPEIVTYYVILGLIFIVATPHPEEHMNKEIKDGKVSFWLIRPFSWFKNYLAGDAIYRHVQVFTLAPIGIIVLIFFREYFIFTNVVALMLTIAASIIAFLAFFQLSFCIGCAAFWLDDAYGVHNVYWFFIIVFGGAIAPLEFMPQIMQKIANFLPFKYFHYFPVKLYLGHLSSFEIAQGFLILGFWLVAAFCIYKTVWHFGTRRYSAVGG